MTKIGEAMARAIISAPIEHIHLADWMFGITSEEYAACADGHQSAAQGRLPSGTRVSINLEYVAGFFMVQHYIETISHKDHVKAISPNTILWIDDSTYVMAQITWELRATRIDDASCELTCTVISETENQVLAKRVHENTKGMAKETTPLQQHIDEETVHFAKDIERKAVARVWN